MRIDLLVVHHTATPMSWTVERLRRLHVDENGWRDIGYHYIVRLDESGEAVTEEGRLHDGDSDLEAWERGAHARGVNARSLGVATVGDWSKGEMDKAIRGELVATLGALCVKHGLKPGAVVGHREVKGASTECPGRYVDLAALREEVADWMAGTAETLRRLER